MTTLYAGPWIAELGWELFCWQGYLRHRSRHYDKTVIACEQGHEVLYQDFADEIIPVKLNVERRYCWKARGYKTPEPEQLFGGPLDDGIWYRPNEAVVVYAKQSINFEQQEFVKLGNNNRNGYDIVVHARCRTLAPNRNWPLKSWHALLHTCDGATVACIGSKQDALHVAGDDLRGIPLADLCDVLASSRLIVGPSSGPMHLASLCGCPQVVWFGEPAYNERRYKTDWNPLGTPVTTLFQTDWQPSVKTVAAMIDKAI